MPTYRTFQTNFSAGILDDLMLSRSDVKAYDNGAEQLTNWWPLVQGGVRRRPGTLFLGDLTEEYHIVEFEFNDTQRYAICFGEQKLKIVPIDAGGFGSAIDITVGVPWSLADFERVRWVSYGDIIIIAHEDHPLKILTRTGATSFTIADYEFEEDPSGWPKYRPFYAFQAAGVTLTPSGKSGSITLTTSDDYFEAGHVGVLLRYKGKQIEITGYTSATQVTGTVREILDDAIQLTVGSTSGFTLGETIYGVTSGAKGTLASIDSATTMTVDMQSGSFSPTEEVQGLTSNSSSSCTAKATVTPVATYNWDEEAISSLRGYVSSVVLHQQRLWLGGTRDIPLFLAGSQSAALFNFYTGEGLDNESIQYVISSSNGGQIRSMVSGIHLQVFTDQAEYYAPESNELPLTPKTMSIRRVTNYGTSNAIPIGFDNTTLMVQKGGKVIREMVWNEIEQSYQAPAVSLPSTLYIDDIKETTVLYSIEDQPEQLSFFLNNDGTIAIYHSAKAEQISGWHHWTTDGEFISIRAISEKLYTVAKRTINSVTEYYFEEFSFDAIMDSCLFVEDAGPTPISTFTGFTHLANHEVDVNLSYDDNGTWQDNAYYLERFTVSGAGAIDISDPNNYEGLRICAGLKFPSPLAPMPFEKVFQDGSRMGEMKAIVSVAVMLKDSVAIEVDGYDLLTRTVNDDISKPPPLVSGLHEFYLLGWARKAQVILNCDVPLPCTVLGLFSRVEF